MNFTSRISYATPYEAATIVNLDALRHRAGQAVEESGERNLESLRSWISFVESVGKPVSIDGVLTTQCEESSFWEADRDYVQIDGLGRAYEIGDGPQGCTREARHCGFLGLCMAEVDIIVSNYQLFLLEIQNVAINEKEYFEIARPIGKHIEHSKMQREKVAEYYNITSPQSKEIFARLPLDGSIKPDPSWESTNGEDVLPFLLELRSAFRRGRKMLSERCAKCQSICHMAKVLNANHPDVSALALLLQDAENKVLGTMAECVAKFGLRVLS